MDYGKNYWYEAYRNFVEEHPTISDGYFKWYPCGQYEINIESLKRGWLAYDDKSRTLYLLNDNINSYTSRDGFMSFFIQSLRYEMMSRGISQSALARAIGMTPVIVNRYLTGKAIPNIYTVYHIARVLGCSINDLIFEKIPRERYVTSKNDIIDTDVSEQYAKCWNWVVEDMFRWYPTFSTDIIEWYPINQTTIVIKTFDGAYYKYDWMTKVCYGKTYEPVTATYDEYSKEEWTINFYRRLNSRIATPGGMGQDLLAYLTDIPSSTISRYTTGQRTPNIYNLYKIAHVLKCSTSELIG